MKKFWLLILIWLSYYSFILPQSLPLLEANYNKLQSELAEEHSKLDSLKNILELRAKKIDSEKSKADFNKDVVTGIMAGSISISNQIDELQKKIFNMESENENLKKELSERYTAIIDSLQALANKNDLSNSKSNEIKKEIFLTTEKKLLVSPKVLLLSFHPEKIIGINLGKITDEAQKKIYKEYLQKALAEVKDRLKNVNENITEVENIIALQKKTRNFLEETEFESNIPGLTSSDLLTQSSARVDAYSAEPETGVNASFSSQVQQYSLLLSQLQQPLTMQSGADVSKIKVKVSGGHQNVSYPQYLKLLRATKSSLMEYSLILVHKLEQSR